MKVLSDQNSICRNVDLATASNSQLKNILNLQSEVLRLTGVPAK